MRSPQKNRATAAFPSAGDCVEPWATADYFSVFATHVFMGVTAVFFWRKILPAQCHKVWPCVFAGCTLFLLAGGFIFFQLTQS